MEDKTTDTTGHQAESHELPMIEDPVEFITHFRESSWYQKAYEEFFKGKKLAPDATEREKTQAFLESEHAKYALVDFGTKEAHLRYNPDQYPLTSRHAINTYVASIEDVVKMTRGGATKEEIMSLDELRFHYHETAAQEMVKDGVVPTTKLGRALARLILIDKGLDTRDNAREPDVNRVYRKFGL